MPQKILFTCPTCHQQFHPWDRGQIFCSKTCRGKKERRTLVERFVLQIGNRDSDTGCIHWLGAVDTSGYGQTFLPRERMSRFAYELANGPIPDGLHVLHRCDIHYPPGDITYRRCVNHEHLFLGSHEDNMKDMKSKGRASRAPRNSGTCNPMAKLNDDAVREIRRLYASGGVFQKDIAKQFGVASHVISSVITRKRWSHVA